MEPFDRDIAESELLRRTIFEEAIAPGVIISTFEPEIITTSSQELYELLELCSAFLNVE